MGFLLAGNALLVLFLLLLLLRKVYGDDWEGLYEVGEGWRQTWRVSAAGVCRLLGHAAPPYPVRNPV